MQSPPANAEATSVSSLSPRVGPPPARRQGLGDGRRVPQAQVLGEGGAQEQAGIGHQAVVIKDDADPVVIVLWQHLLGAPCFQAVFCPNHYPRFRGAPSGFFKDCPQSRLSVDSG